MPPIVPLVNKAKIAELTVIESLAKAKYITIVGIKKQKYGINIFCRFLVIKSMAESIFLLAYKNPLMQKNICTPTLNHQAGSIL